MKSILAASLISFIILNSCSYVGSERVRGDGNIKSKTISTGNISALETGGAFTVYIRQDSVTTTRVETDDNLLEYIDIAVKGNTLHIRSRDGFNLRPSGKIKVYVSSPVFNRLNASGACDIISENQIISNEGVNIDLSGASRVDLSLKTPNVHAILSGAGTISLKGETKDLRIDGSGSTDIKCFDMKTENTHVEISGAGDAEVFASVKLEVEVSGAGTVKYKGSPVVEQKISGAGSVKKVD